MTAPTYDTDERPEINPLIEPTTGETCAAVASALGWIMAADLDRLSTTAMRDGLSYALLPAITALELAAQREEGCFILDPARAQRLRILASRYTEGNLLDTFDQGMDAFEVSKIQARAIDETPEARRARYARVRDLAQSWVDEIDGAVPPAEAEG